MIFLGITAFLILYIVANLYVGNKILLWLAAIYSSTNKTIFWIIYFLCAFSFIIAYLIPRSYFAKIFKLASGFYMVAFLYTLIIFLILDIVKVLFARSQFFRENIIQNNKFLVISGFVIFAIVLLIILYGNYNAKNIQIVDYSLKVSEKSNKKLNIVMISDIHIGDIINHKEIDKIVGKIKGLNPDIVLISGDVFDGYYDGIENIDKIEKSFKDLKTKYGTYAVFGNHDAGSGYSKMVEFCRKSNINLLQDEFKEFKNDFTIIGRKDGSPIGDQGEVRKELENVFKHDITKPIIMLDHKPSDINEISDYNIDLLLCGHTHRGQMFPGSLITNRIFLVDYGYLKVKNTNVIVSSGVGTWGPRIRIGSKSEIVNIKLEY